MHAEMPNMASLLEERSRTINMAAGPSSLPTPVLLESCAGLLNFQGTGIGLTELSHRSSHFQKCLKDAEADLRDLLCIPDNFDVLFLQGGGLTQFSMVPMNLVSAWKVNTQNSDEPVCEYVVSGSWSLKAAGEATRLGFNVNIVVDGRTQSPEKLFGSAQLPPSSEWKWTTSKEERTKPAFIYYCSNETVNGIEISPPDVPIHLADVPIVADMSSNILSRAIPWSSHNFGLVYAGAQKNIGPAGLTIIIIRKDLVVHPDEATMRYHGMRIPAMMSYKMHNDNASLYNTPPMFSIYVAGLVFKHLKALGGVGKIEEINIMKAESVWKVIDGSRGFYEARVIDGMRSRMNICFGIPGEGRETRFIQQAGDLGIKQIKGHR